jgi:hypothetical protein
MAYFVALSDNVHGYQQLVRMLIARGDLVASRVGDTLELEDMTIALNSTEAVIPFNRTRYSPLLGLMEAAQLVGGFSDPDALRLVVPRIGEYTDFYGAYGPRVKEQLPILVSNLLNDPDSRRGVLEIWSSELDAAGGHRDHPCTLSITFRHRNGRLNMSVHMRSNDVWRGWAYDAVQFGILQRTIANVLDLMPGTYTHHADSFHLYCSDLEVATAYVNFPLNNRMSEDGRISGFGWKGCSLAQAQQDARMAVAGATPDFLHSHVSRELGEGVRRRKERIAVA